VSLLSRKGQDEPRVDRRRSLAGVPALNDNVLIDRSNDQAWVLTIKLPRGKGWFSRFMPPTITKRHELDELGTFVLKQVDGRRRVLDIVDAFVARYKTNRREAELSVVKFFKSLIERRIVSIIIK